MGKPFQDELDQIPSTWDWAVRYDITDLARVIATCCEFPLVACGSGGSLSAAHHAAFLHRYLTSQIAVASTPIDAQYHRLTSGNIGYLLISAGGSNGDILRAFKSVVTREPTVLTSLVARKGSKLEDLSSHYRYANSLAFENPAGNDGFLATNSLFAFCSLLSSAYNTVFQGDPFPVKWDDLMKQTRPYRSRESRALHHSSTFWQRNNFIVLHSAALQAAAWDIESKFTEAALGTVQIADFRHFAHGRHHWLAKRGGDSAVLALIHIDETEMARSTLSLLPNDIPVVQIEFFGSTLLAGISGLYAALQLTHAVGTARGVDPGRPGVPPFGRRIYNLRVPSATAEKRSAEVALPVSRKVWAADRIIVAESQQRRWIRHHKAFCNRLDAATFVALVADYDGTLCDACDKKRGISEPILAGLNAILLAGVPVGIATGRGRSVRSDLVAAIPSEFHKLITVGYYNGAQVLSLADAELPDREIAAPQMKMFAAALRKEAAIAALALPVECRGGQISIQPMPTAPLQPLRSIVRDLANRLDPGAFRVVESNHSIDVILRGTNKLSVTTHIRSQFDLPSDAPVLTIGDRGDSLGNDFELLSTPWSLSVDRVSDSSDSCWNLAPAGHRGAQAMVSYLRVLRPRNATFRIATNKIRPVRQFFRVP